MYAEGETEIRDLIVQSLDSSGFLDKIKAEIRAGVFLAFEEEGSLRSKIPLFNKQFDEFIDTTDGKFIVSVFREFLEYFKLKFTLSVFDPEISVSNPCLSRAELCNKLNIKSSEVDGPIISILLKNYTCWTEKKNIGPLKDGEVHSDLKMSGETVSDNVDVKNNKLLEKFSCNDTVLDSTFSSSTFHIEGVSNNKNASSNMKATDNAVDGFSETTKNDSPCAETRNDEKSSAKTRNSNGVFKISENASILESDDFFDSPLPSQSQNFFSMLNEKTLTSNTLLSSLGSKHNLLLEPEKNPLSSLKNLPVLSTAKSKECSFTKESPRALPDLKSSKQPQISEKTGGKEKDPMEVLQKKDLDRDSNEESSEKQFNSEESIEEEIDDDVSTGLDDLLNSSSSVGEEATSDQTVSQVSVVDGVDHMEAIT